MKQPITKISINEEWALRVGKQKFIEALKSVYPDVNLEKEFDKISPPKEKTQKP